ncbi:deaminase [Actinoalloteichus sp. AHMU CJ021]|uniref:dihydrofolate reductase family protein n=1 Tax=Actinoalloteichus TaxID=65496 RepID=UPI00037DACF2|nr:dihydrofolate reductase family protein [Actinoalloteichus spitiensis]AUS81117.1 deaminase [Actinoalloteichus sp. AHMU CJ021]
MRRLKLQVQTTVDGYLAGPNGEMDWMTLPWSEDLNDYVKTLMAPVDHIMLGRHLAEGFIPTWAANPDGETEETVAWMNDTPKTVVSNTLTESPWENAVIAGGDLAAVVHRLKDEPGGDLIAYGGATLVSGLIGGGLVDEMHLLVNPVAIGAGLPVFPPLAEYQRLRLVTAQPFDCGITALRYEPSAG